jgi:tetratricopeptide (TPR) repeat protein
MMCALVEFFSRHFRAAEDFYRQALAQNRTGGVDFPGAVRFVSALGFIRQNSGDQAEGRALLEEARALDEKELSSAPDNPAHLYSLAANEAALGEKQAAVSTLDRAIAAGWIDYHSVQLDPRFDQLRDLPAFEDSFARLVRKLEQMRRDKTSREGH